MAASKETEKPRADSPAGEAGFRSTKWGHPLEVSGPGNKFYAKLCGSARLLVMLTTQWPTSQPLLGSPYCIFEWPGLAKLSSSKKRNIVRPFCWCYAITPKAKISRFCFRLCRPLKLCGLCRIKRNLSSKCRLLILELEVIYFVFPGREYACIPLRKNKKVHSQRVYLPSYQER